MSRDAKRCAHPQCDGYLFRTVPGFLTNGRVGNEVVRISAGINISWLNGQFRELSNIAFLGGGGQKTVYSANHQVDGDVVLKLIHPTQDPEGVRREILAVSAIHCERVPRIHEQGNLSSDVGDLIWIREQRVVGRSLRDIINGGALPPDGVLRLGLHILEALAAAEEQEIVHRDVKPDNVMQANDGNFWLLDFGIARHLQLTSMTPTVSPFGKFTPGYAPPEQFRNIKSDIDSRADLFAAGVTLYEAGTGNNPFRSGARDVMEMLRRTEHQPLPPLLINIRNQEALRDLISAMTQKRRDQRPRTVADALTWLREIVARQ